MRELALSGCTAMPMMAYLKALGVLRVLAEQKDPGARGRWQGDVFHLTTSLDEPAVTAFFLQEYRPTPIVTPWNGGSGFYEGDNTSGRDAIQQTTAPRFQEYRDTIETILGWDEIPQPNQTLEELTAIVATEAARAKGKRQADLRQKIHEMRAAMRLADRSVDLDRNTVTIEHMEALVAGPGKIPDMAARTAVRSALQVARKVRTEAKKVHRAALKDDLVSICRNRLGDRTVEWIDAAVAVGADGKLAHPPILGTGGIEGRLEYGNIFMQAIATLFPGGTPSPDAEPLLHNALSAAPTDSFVIASTGQHDPGRAGGFNQGPGIATKDVPTNPWDLVLALEGVIVWSGNVTRRQGAAMRLFDRPVFRGTLTSPFTVRPRPVGYVMGDALNLFNLPIESRYQLLQLPSISTLPCPALPAR